MTEAALQRSIQKAISDAGGKCYKIHGGPYSVAGAPDLIGSINGKPFAIEVKLPGKKKTLTAKQAYELEQWAKQGWNVGVATTIDLKARGRSLAATLQDPTTCQLIAIHLPCAIADLPALVSGGGS